MRGPAIGLFGGIAGLVDCFDAMIRPRPYGETLSPVFLDLDFEKAFKQDRVGAYERLLLDAIAGRLNLFVRSDEQEEAWRWVEPILRAWEREDPTSLLGYAAGSAGPAAVA